MFSLVKRKETSLQNNKSAFAATLCSFQPPLVSNVVLLQISLFVSLASSIIHCDSSFGVNVVHFFLIVLIVFIITVFIIIVFIITVFTSTPFHF